MKKAVIITSIVLVVGGGAYYYYTRQINMLENLEYKGTGLQIITMTEDLVVVTLRLRITSKSTLEAVITDLNLDFYLNDIKLANVVDDKKIVIPAKGYSDVDLKISFSPKEIRQDFVTLASYFIQTSDANIKLNGYAKVKSAFITLRLPFEYETTLREFMAS